MQYTLIAALLCALFPFSGYDATTQQHTTHAHAARTPQQQSIAITDNEGLALRTLRMLFKAENTFQTTTGKGEYGELDELLTAGLIDKDLASGLKENYRFTVKVKKSSLTTPPAIDLFARPVEYGKKARRSFYLNESGVLLTSEVKDVPLSEMRPFASEVGLGKPKPSPTPEAEESEEASDTSGDVEANEEAAIATLQAIHTAENTFKSRTKAGQYGTLEQLKKERLLDAARAAEMQSGYLFKVHVPAGTSGATAMFTATAVPRVYGISGRRSFYVDHTGVIRGTDNEGGPADSGHPPIERKQQ